MSRVDYPSVRRRTDHVKRLDRLVSMSGIFPSAPRRKAAEPRVAGLRDPDTTTSSSASTCTWADRWRRWWTGVAPGGTLLLLGHRPVDPATEAATPAEGQVQISVDEAVAALDPAGWEFVVAEDRTRAAAGTGVDAVIRARRLS